MQILLNAVRRSHKLQQAVDHISCGQTVSLLVRQQALLKLIFKAENMKTQTIHSARAVIEMPSPINSFCFSIKAVIK